MAEIKNYTMNFGPQHPAAHGVLRLNYVMDDGVRVVQSLTFAPDGRSARNTMSFRKFGLNVATLEGTIHRVAVE